MVEKRILIDGFGFGLGYMIYDVYYWSVCWSIKRMNTLKQEGIASI